MNSSYLVKVCCSLARWGSIDSTAALLSSDGKYLSGSRAEFEWR